MSSRSDWLAGVTLNTWDTYPNDLAIDGQLVVRNRMFLDKELSGTAASPSIAFGNGDTGFFEIADDRIGISIGGTRIWEINSSSLSGAVNGSPQLQGEAPTSTNPTLLPNGTDLDTGIGHNAADEGSLIAGGNEKYRFTADGGTITAVCNNDTVICNNNEIVFT